MIVIPAFLLSGCVKSRPKNYKLQLEIWGTFDDSSAFAEAIKEFREINPNIAGIKYRKMDADTYKKDLVSAMAAGKGPDIFFIQNTWVSYFQDKIVPAPGWMIGEQEFRQNFVDVVVNDFMDQGLIFGVPLSVDSLALYYNKDLFNAEGIANPPEDWEKLTEYSRRLTKIDKFGNINQQGIALGTAYNINRATDILSLLTYQFGSEIAGKGQKVSFSSTNNAGEKALDFYTQFARSDSPVYTWNSRVHHSIDSFNEGKTAMMINYSWQYAAIKKRSPKLNFAVSNLPQMDSSRPVNHANYWALVVARNKPVITADKKGPPVNNNVRILESWQLVKFLTFNNKGKFSIINGLEYFECLAKKQKSCERKSAREGEIKIDPALTYISKTGRPAARRDLLEG